MKRSLWNTFVGALVACLFGPAVLQTLAADAGAGPTKEYRANADEFSALAKSVVELLQSGASVSFARSIVPTLDDWKSILSTNLPPQTEDPLASFQKSGPFLLGKVEVSAKDVLDRAAEMHLDFSKGDWQSRVVLPEHFGNKHYPSLQAETETIPSSEQIEIVLLPGGVEGATTNGQFTVALRGLLKFPGGWRCTEGIQWEAFPNNLVDEKTRRELAVLNKVAAGQSINGQDDPSLLKLGETLVRFLREGDVSIFENDAFITADLLWAQSRRTPRRTPSRADLERQLSARAKGQIALAQACLQLMSDTGVELKNAAIQIKAVTIEEVQAQGPRGSLDGLVGSQFKLELVVRSDEKSRNGTSLTGDYALGANEVMRFEEEWRVADNLHWQQFPEGMLGREQVAKMNLENYVSEHGTLPPGTAAPEIGFTTLEGEKPMKLSELKGKVVVLDFWATWCGPCQGPMAELQKLRAAHSDWKERVAIMPLSIDDKLETVRNHVDQRGWTNTFNVWVGEGGWQATPVQTFRVNGVPTTYIINQQGLIIKAGHPASMDIGKEVDALLRPMTSSAR